MQTLTKVHLPALSPKRFRSVAGDQFKKIEPDIARAREDLAGRVIWHVNSTARGGGVAEMLRSYLAYGRGAGVDVRWVVIGGDQRFFEVTKRIHNNLHGASGDGGVLGPDERSAYESALEGPSEALASVVRAGDVVFLHDPQTAGLVSSLHANGAAVIWRCHVGVEDPNELVNRGWDFLRPYLTGADALVFSRTAFVWDGLRGRRIWIMPPTIDAFSPKNQAMTAGTVGAVLATIGLAPVSAPRRWAAKLASGSRTSSCRSSGCRNTFGTSRKSWQTTPSDRLSVVGRPQLGPGRRFRDPHGPGRQSPSLSLGR